MHTEAGEHLALPRRADHVVARRIGDAGILVNLRTNEIFELNDTAMRVWELLGECADGRRLREQILTEFDVSLEVASRDIAQSLERFVAQGVVVA